MASLGVRAASAAVMIPLTARHIAPHNLGFWYIFTNVFAFVLVLDAGLSVTIGRLIASRPDFFKAKDTPSEEMLRFYGTVRRIYLLIGPLTFLVLAFAGGAWIWSKSSPGDVVRLAWILFCPSFALSVVANLGRGFLFGINRLDLFNILSTFATVVQFVIVVCGLLYGFGLYALVCGNLAIMSLLALMLPLYLWTSPAARQALALGRHDPATSGRILSAASGTFLNTLASFSVLNANLLVASIFLPLHVTASYGLTLQCFFLACQASSVWLEIKHPLYAQLRAHDPGALHRLFIVRMRFCIATFLVCTMVLATFGNHLLALIGAQTFLLPTPQLLVLALFVALYTHHSHFEMLGLCLGHNPFTRAYLITAGCGLLAVFLLTPHLGLWGALLAPFCAQLAFNNWWVPLQGMRLMALPPENYFRGLIGLKTASAN